ncbi:OLC1v1030247C1 [Oldenlandia corymbosa var. corymbosa]|uniref:OLC1v1030247C1 n=1 Tax=Oldenlandia corymbosa var. corymbosa TaxID=529605 RepID=A0AAV1CIM4_OLDCO|nr:OLC1v1030247C1 [Oldenlandia corymbosa var. corymbosa]
MGKRHVEEGDNKEKKRPTKRSPVAALRDWPANTGPNLERSVAKMAKKVKGVFMEVMCQDKSGGVVGQVPGFDANQSNLTPNEPGSTIVAEEGQCSEDRR